MAVGNHSAASAASSPRDPQAARALGSSVLAWGSLVLLAHWRHWPTVRARHALVAACGWLCLLRKGALMDLPGAPA